MTTRARWRRFWGSEMGALLGALVVALLVGVLLFYPRRVQVCGPPNERGYRECHSDSVYGFLPHEAMLFFDRHEGFFFVVLTVGLAIFARRQTAIMAAQTALMERSIASANEGQRAYVFVNTTATSNASIAEGKLSEHDTARPLHVVNLGNTPARIDSHAATLHGWAGMPWRMDAFPTVHEFWLDSRITSGAMMVEVVLTAEILAAVRSGLGKLALSGYVRYRDVFGGCHETTFCFYFDHVTHRLEMIPGEGLNDTKPIRC